GLVFPLSNENWHVELQEARGGPTFAGNPEQGGVVTSRTASTPSGGERTIYQVNPQQISPAAAYQYAMGITDVPLRNTVLEMLDAEIERRDRLAELQTQQV